MRDQVTTNEKIAVRVSVNSIIVNVILSAFKLFAGIFASSSAMVSDSVHSISDVLSTFIVIAGVKIANKASDENHQYGHERFECVAALLLAFLLGVTGVSIGYGGILTIARGEYQAAELPGMLALIAAVVSIVIKEAMYWYTKNAAAKIKSSALLADAWHHRSDAFSSIGSFLGILGARMGYPVLDPIASVVICILIVKAAWGIFSGAVRKVTDEACPQETIEKIRGTILAQEGVLSIDQLSTRMFGDRQYVDVEIGVNGKMMLEQAHSIAETVHDELERTFPEIKHCMVHVNPFLPEE